MWLWGRGDAQGEWGVPSHKDSHTFGVMCYLGGDRTHAASHILL